MGSGSANSPRQLVVWVAMDWFVHVFISAHYTAISKTSIFRLLSNNL